MGNFHNLDNEEVLFVYLSNRKFIDKYDKVFEMGGMESSIELDEGSFVTSFREMSDDELYTLMQNPHYQYCVSIEEKLLPIIELIKETLPELYDKVESSFKSNI